eukprot:g517.t1
MVAEDEDEDFLPQTFDDAPWRPDVWGVERNSQIAAKAKEYNLYVVVNEASALKKSDYPGQWGSRLVPVLAPGTKTPVRVPLVHWRYRDRTRTTNAEGSSTGDVHLESAGNVTSQAAGRSPDPNPAAAGGWTMQRRRPLNEDLYRKMLDQTDLPALQRERIDVRLGAPPKGTIAMVKQHEHAPPPHEAFSEVLQNLLVRQGSSAGQLEGWNKAHYMPLWDSVVKFFEQQKEEQHAAAGYLAATESSAPSLGVGHEVKSFSTNPDDYVMVDSSSPSDTLRHPVLFAMRAGARARVMPGEYLQPVCYSDAVRYPGFDPRVGGKKGGVPDEVRAIHDCRGLFSTAKKDKLQAGLALQKLAQGLFFAKVYGQDDLALPFASSFDRTKALDLGRRFAGHAWGMSGTAANAFATTVRTTGKIVKVSAQVLDVVTSRGGMLLAGGALAVWARHNPEAAKEVAGKAGEALVSGASHGLAGTLKSLQALDTSITHNLRETSEHEFNVGEQNPFILGHVNSADDDHCGQTKNLLHPECWAHNAGRNVHQRWDELHRGLTKWFGSAEGKAEVRAWEDAQMRQLANDPKYQREILGVSWQKDSSYTHDCLLRYGRYPPGYDPETETFAPGTGVPDPRTMTTTTTPATRDSSSTSEEGGLLQQKVGAVQEWATKQKEWVAANPGKAVAVALGVAAAGYGAYRGIRYWRERKNRKRHADLTDAEAAQLRGRLEQDLKVVAEERKQDIEEDRAAAVVATRRFDERLSLLKARAETLVVEARAETLAVDDESPEINQEGGDVEGRFDDNPFAAAKEETHQAISDEDLSPSSGAAATARWDVAAEDIGTPEWWWTARQEAARLFLDTTPKRLGTRFQALMAAATGQKQEFGVALTLDVMATLGWRLDPETKKSSSLEQDDDSKVVEKQKKQKHSSCLHLQRVLTKLREKLLPVFEAAEQKSNDGIRKTATLLNYLRSKAGEKKLCVSGNAETELGEFVQGAAFEPHSLARSGRKWGLVGAHAAVPDTVAENSNAAKMLFQMNETTLGRGPLVVLASHLGRLAEETVDLLIEVVARGDAELVDGLLVKGQLMGFSDARVGNAGVNVKTAAKAAKTATGR